MNISYYELTQMQRTVDEARQAGWSPEQLNSFKMALAVGHCAECNNHCDYSKLDEVDFAMSIVKMLK